MVQPRQCLAAETAVVRDGAAKLALHASREKFEVIVLRPRFVLGRDDTTALPQLLKALDSGKFAWIDGGRY